MSIVFALVCGLCYGANNIWTNRLPLELTGKLVFYRSFLTFLLNLLLTFLLWKIYPTIFPVSYDLVAILQNIFLAGFLFIGLIYLFKGLEKGPVSIVGTIIGSTGILSALLAVVVYNEALSSFKLASIILGIVSLGVVSVDFGNVSKVFASPNGIKYAIVTFFVFGIGFTLTKPLIIALGPLLFSTIVELTNCVLALIYLHFTKNSIFHNLTRFELLNPIFVIFRNFNYLIISAGLIVLAGVSQNFALTSGSVSTIEPIIRLTLALSSIVMSFLILKEKVNRQQILGLCGLVSSLVMIGL